jgi:pimeloyl-ACP methyl ester carboxylesterase
MLKHLVVIHGLNSTSNSFNFILNQLQHTADSVTCVNYKSHQPLVDTLAEVEAQFPKTGELILVGHSLGGVISILLAHKLPDRIKRVLTISSPIGGSKAAFYMQWLPGSPPVLRDITPNGPLIKLAQQKPAAQVYSIVTFGGSLPTTTEPNDSVVTVRSQRATPAPRSNQVQVRANHFEVLMMPRTVKHIHKFLET